MINHNNYNQKLKKLTNWLIIKIILLITNQIIRICRFLKYKIRIWLNQFQYYLHYSNWRKYSIIKKLSQGWSCWSSNLMTLVKKYITKRIYSCLQLINWKKHTCNANQRVHIMRIWQLPLCFTFFIHSFWNQTQDGSTLCLRLSGKLKIVTVNVV